jgi:hypothetical protein
MTDLTVSLPPDATKESILEELEALKNPSHPRIKDFKEKIPGVKPGSEEEIFVLNVMLEVAKLKDRQNTEITIVTDIGRPKDGKPTPQGRVSVTVDKDNVVSSRLTAAPVVKMFDAKAGIARLKTIFADVKVEGKAWSDTNTGAQADQDKQEISDVIAALDDVKDKSFLKKVELIRVNSLPGKHTGGNFSRGHEGGDKPAIRLSDEMFVDVAHPARKRSVLNILRYVVHEVGHAQEAKNLATIDAAKVKTFKDEVTKQEALAASALADAKQKIPADQVAKSNAYVTAIEEGAKEITSFVAEAEKVDRDKAGIEKLEQLETAVRAKVNAIFDAGAKYQTAEGVSQLAVGPLNDATRAHDKWFEAARVWVWAPGRTLTLQKFVDLVNKNHIEPFTKYARENWPDHPEEFYAEAYSLSVFEPEWLKANYPAISTFFGDTGKKGK